MKRSIVIASLMAFLTTACATGPAQTKVPEVTNAVSPAQGIVSAGRLTASDVTRLKGAGIREVIDLSTPAETPDFDEASALRSAGIEYSNLPLRGAPDLTPDNVKAFDALLRDAQRPLLVHCASGNRVGAMAALRSAWIEGKSVDDAIAIGKQWGLSSLEPQVRERLEMK